MSYKPPFVLSQVRAITTVAALSLPIAIIAILGSSPGNISGGEKAQAMVFLLPLWIVSVIASIGAWERRSWARHFLTGLLSLPCFVFSYAAIMTDDYLLLTISLILLLTLIWYFYWKSSTIAFFESE